MQVIVQIKRILHEVIAWANFADREYPINEIIPTSSVQFIIYEHVSAKALIKLHGYGRMSCSIAVNLETGT